MDN
ncbi:glycosyl transferases group 1 family protein, partial [Vibrio parahaemolyticus EKP-028]|jgi:hypothetical protein